MPRCLVLAALLVAATAPAAAAQGAADWKKCLPLKLQPPVRFEKIHMELRLSSNFTPPVEGTGEGGVRAGVLADLVYQGEMGGNYAFELGEETETLEQAIARTKEYCRAQGFSTKLDDRTPDAVLGTIGKLELRQAQYERDWVFYYVRRRGRLMWVKAAYDDVTGRVFAPIVVPLVLSVRSTTAIDARLDPPSKARSVEASGLTLVAEKRRFLQGKATKAAEQLVAGFKLAAALTGGSPPTDPRVHCFSTTATLQLVAGGKPKDVPTAQYLAAGRLIVVHTAATNRPAKGAADRYRAALWAHLDARTQTPHGLYPWVRAGLSEAVFSAAASGAPALGDSALASWLKKNSANTAWPRISEFLKRRTPVTDSAERAYATALVLAIHEAKDPTIHGMLRRYFAELAASTRPDLALAKCLEGVDLSALDAAAKRLLE